MSISPYVTYKGTAEEVRVGDHVVVTVLFFLKKKGRVVYVPGVSPRNEDMHAHGVEYVGIREESGAEISAVVDAEKRFPHYVRLIKHDLVDAEELKPDRRGFSDDGEGPPSEAPKPL